MTAETPTGVREQGVREQDVPEQRVRERGLEGQGEGEAGAGERLLPGPELDVAEPGTGVAELDTGVPEPNTDVAEPEAESGAPDEPAEAGSARARRSGSGWPAAVLAVALVFCGFAGWIHWTVRSDADLAYSQARDQALDAGRTHIAALNSIDARHVGTGLKGWRAATTGPLREELGRTAGKNAEALRERGTSARARVTAAALTALDERAGTAAMIATVRIEATTRAGSPATDRKRFEAGLERTGDGWKLTSLTPVPVGKER